MMITIESKLPINEILQLCNKYSVSEISVFGSILREDFSDKSDVDFLVVFQDNDAGPWMSRATALEEELSSLLHRPVDVVLKRAVEKSRNGIRRRSILDNAVVIYE